MENLKDMIYKGLCDGKVKIIGGPDDNIACQIGDYWFYFMDLEYEALTPDEIYEVFTKEELTDRIYKTLLDLEADGFEEVEYYKEYLCESQSSSAISREELAELCDARDKLCDFCENYEHCEKCQVTRLIDDAYAACDDVDE